MGSDAWNCRSKKRTGTSGSGEGLRYAIQKSRSEPPTTDRDEQGQGKQEVKCAPERRACAHLTCYFLTHEGDDI